MIITLTPEAIDVVKGALTKTVHPKGLVYTALRVGVRGGGCSGYEYALALLTADEVQEDWTREDHDGLQVYIDPMSAMHLEGVSIDYVSLMADGCSGFKFTNPNAVRQCGCGKSFS